MAFSRASSSPVAALAMAVVALVLVFGMANAQDAAAPAPAPAPTSDGITIDQGIAYVLMLVALVLTYLIHPLDATSSFRLV